MSAQLFLNIKRVPAVAAARVLLSMKMVMQSLGAEAVMEVFLEKARKFISI